jgi:hypothetical protein
MITDQLPNIVIKSGEEFIVTFPSSKSISLTHEEWLGFRVVQNALIHTEPTRATCQSGC